MKKYKKPLVALLACALLVMGVVGGTMAWLVDTSAPVINTFTVGDINIDLKETLNRYIIDPESGSPAPTFTAENEYHFVPGDTFLKDPKVTVAANSEACWLFVHVAEENNTVDDVTVINWAIRDGWTQVTGKTGYWYKEVAASTTAQEFYVLAGDTTGDYANGKVTVNENVTKDMVDDLTAKQPKITVTAAAVQQAHIESVEKAWNNLPSTFKGSETDFVLTTP